MWPCDLIALPLILIIWYNFAKYSNYWSHNLTTLSLNMIFENM